MADRSQPGQRNVFHSTAYKPDNKRDYHENYMQGLSFWATDFPVHAQKSGASTVAKHTRLSMPHRKNVYGHHVDAGETTEMQYDSLYPGALQGTNGAQKSHLWTRKDQVPRVRTPPGNRQGKIPSKFVVKPSSSPAAAAQIAAQAFGDTTRSFGPRLQRLQPADEHFVVEDSPNGSMCPGRRPMSHSAQPRKPPTSPQAPARDAISCLRSRRLRRWATSFCDGRITKRQ